eukprot:1191279-Prorocentrum_minimum.AAC.1
MEDTANTETKPGSQNTDADGSAAHYAGPVTVSEMELDYDEEVYEEGGDYADYEEEPISPDEETLMNLEDMLFLNPEDRDIPAAIEGLLQVNTTQV